MSNSIMEIVESKLGDGDFLSISQLVRSGVYGSEAAVRLALKRGDLQFLKVSPNRTLILKDSVMDLIRRKNSSSKKGVRGESKN